jgi:hypothetical protein
MLISNLFFHENVMTRQADIDVLFTTFVSCCADWSVHFLSCGGACSFFVNWNGPISQQVTPHCCHTSPKRPAIVIAHQVPPPTTTTTTGPPFETPFGGPLRLFFYLCLLIYRNIFFLFDLEKKCSVTWSSVKLYSMA